MAKLAEGAWEGRGPSGRPTIITKTKDGGRQFQTQRADGTWSSHFSASRKGDGGGRESVAPPRQ